MKRNIVSALFAIVLGAVFAVPASAQNFQADSKINVRSIQVANNTTATVVKATGGTVYSIEAFNNNTTLAYVKVYNAASATCGSGTPQARYMIPASASATLMSNANGDAYVNGVTVCVTTGYGDSDTGAPAATTYIVNVHYK